MASNILFEVDILQRSRDREGVNYDVAIEYVGDVLPGGAIDPDGAEVLVACSRKATHEDLRDTIRSVVQNTLVSSYNFPSVSFSEIRVEGHSNQGTDVTVTADDNTLDWFKGPAFRPNIPNKNGNVKLLSRVQATFFFNENLLADQRYTKMTPHVIFSDGPNISKLRYEIRAYNANTGDFIWDEILPKVGNDCKATFDLSHSAQDALWDAGMVRFTLALRRTAGGQDINANASGKIRAAYINFDGS